MRTLKKNWVKFVGAVFLVLLPLCAAAQLNNAIDTNSAGVPSTNFQIVAMGADSQVWQNVVPSFTNQSGRVFYRTNSYHEIATGLNHVVNGQWMASSEDIQITAGGGMATNGQHEVYFAANINESNAVEIVTPDGKDLRSHIMGLSFYDSATGSNVLFAELQDSTGQLVANNQVVYPNAFTDCDADVRYTYTRAGLEQDIIVKQQFPAPDSFGLNPDTTWLQVWTEFDNPPAPAIEEIQDGADERLDFGAMQMGRGKAFIMGNETNSVPVNKSWRTVQGRTFLVEQVRFDDVAAQLQSLPASSFGGNTNGTSYQPIRGFPNRLPPASKLAKRANEQLKLADKSSPEKGLVLDYQLYSGTKTNFTFRGDTTYFITGTFNLNATTTIEGGTVVKFTNVNPQITLNGPVNCQTGPYHMAVFTSMNDNTVGQTIANSTGAPSGYYALYDLNNNYTGGSNTFAYLRLSYATFGYYDTSGKTNFLKHCQFVNDDNAIEVFGGGLNLQNILIANTQADAIFGLNARITAANLTVDTANKFFESVAGSTLVANNSLLVSAGTGSYTGSCDFTTNSSSVFQTVGAGSHYLATGSPYRDAGTTDVDPGLLSDLKSLTTYPPLWFTNTITSDTTLSPHALRDNDTPDVGYHYVPIDYLSSCIVTNATLTLTNGVALAYFNGTGVALENNSQLVSQGTPLQHNYLAYYNLAQEQPVFLLGFTNSVSASLPIDTYHTNASQNPSVALRLTTVCAPQGAGYILYANYNWLLNTLIIRDCELYGAGGIYYDVSNSDFGTSIDLENNLFQYVPIELYSQAQIATHNNLFRIDNGGPDIENFGSATFVNQDNVCDGCTVVYFDGTIGHNAYLNMDTNSVFSSILSNDVIVTNFTWVPGLLGNYYQSGGGPLLGKGSRTPSQAGLYHYTVTTDEVPETTNTWVAIGYHYVALDTNSQPLDFNGDGIPDYLEDANGDGVQDNGERSWTYFESVKLASTSLNYLIGASPTLIDTNATITDTNCANLNGGTLTISIVTNAALEDTFTINNQGTAAGQIGVSTTNVTYSGTTIGGFSGGTGTNALVITFNANATAAAAQALLQNIAYFYYPTTNESTLTRTVQAVLTDCNSQTTLPAMRSIAVTCPSSVNVMLVIDCSGSMNDTLTGDTKSKIAAARAAAQNFIGALDFPYDQVGLVTFADAATNNSSGLTTNYAFVISKIAALPASGQTAMSNGIALAQAQFPTNNTSNALPLMVLLTDGMPTLPTLPGDVSQPTNAAISAAISAKATGTRLITIGFGSTGDYSPGLLQQLASVPNDFHGASNSTVLESIYGTIALSVCRSITTNQPLSISFSSPTDYRFFPISPTNILLQVTTVGEVTNVQYFKNSIVGSNLLGQANTGSYQFLWTNVTAGTYMLYARATNGSGETATATVTNIVVNDMPSVTITLPTNASSFSPGGNITAWTYATDGDGVSRVDLYSITNNTNGYILIGSNINVMNPTGISNSCVLTNPVPGTYGLFATATDTHGVVGKSKIIVLQVGGAPTVSITSPSNGQKFPPDTTITITATAGTTNVGSSIAKVEFFVNGQFIGNDMTSPYNITQCCWKPGTYVLTARATDSNGLQTVSSAVTIIVMGEIPTPQNGFWDENSGLWALTNIFFGDDSGQFVFIAQDGNLYSWLGLGYDDDGGDDPTNSGLATTSDGENWTIVNSNVWDIFAYTSDGTSQYITGAAQSPADVMNLNGTSVTAVGDGNAFGSTPLALTMFSGNLYAAGNFPSVYNGGVEDTSVKRVARFDTSAGHWVSVGNGIANGAVIAMTVFDNQLYIGGSFTNAGGNSNANYIATLVGNNWMPVGTGVSGTNGPSAGIVTSLAACGTNLYVGGFFDTAGGNTNANGVAIWNGAVWNTLGGGVGPYNDSVNFDNTVPAKFGEVGSIDIGTFPHVYDLVVRGNRVYVCGLFDHVINGTTQVTANNIATALWNENDHTWTWSDMDYGIGYVYGGNYTPFGIVSSLAIGEVGTNGAYDL